MKRTDSPVSFLCAWFLFDGLHFFFKLVVLNFLETREKHLTSSLFSRSLHLRCIIPLCFYSFIYVKPGCLLVHLLIFAASSSDSSSLQQFHPGQQLPKNRRGRVKRTTNWSTSSFALGLFPTPNQIECVFCHESHLPTVLTPWGVRKFTAKPWKSQKLLINVTAPSRPPSLTQSPWLEA